MDEDQGKRVKRRDSREETHEKTHALERIQYLKIEDVEERWCK